MNKPKLKSKKEFVRVDGKLKEVVTIHDEKGKILKRVISASKLEFYFRDLLQIMIGASILAIPVGFTEETWRLGENLPMLNIFGLIAITLIFISAFVYHHYYREHLGKHSFEFLKRVFFTYAASFLVVALLLYLINVTPWSTDFVLSFKRVAIVTFPSSMSAAIADVLK
ncbi:DUF2391 family protein [Nanoarchaeota archaeon]